MNNNEDPQAILSLNNICWQTGSRLILKNVSCELKAGSFTGILGPNGAGKSTLLRCMYRYLRPTSGVISFNNVDINTLNSKDYAKRVAVVLQHTPQDFQLSVVDVISLGLTPHKSWLSGISNSDKEIVNSALIKVGLVGKRDNDFETLSGGEKQRVMIARAIVQQPQILIMDEPTSHLDVKYQIQIMELAKSLGITVIASFHDINLASAICDNMLLLKEGELVSSGAPQDVITEQTLSNVFDVCTQVTRHPQNNAPHVTYFYGYQSDKDAKAMIHE